MLFRRLQKRLAERILAGELTEHLGYAAGEAKPAGQGESRNGSSAKTVLTETGALPLDIPRDRAGRSRRSSCPRACVGSPNRRERPLALRARDERARDPGPPGTALPGRGVARDDQRGHRRRARGGDRVAAAAPRSVLPRGDLRCAARHNPRRRRRPEQGRVSRAGHRSRWAEGHPGPLGRADRGRPLLAPGDDGLAESRGLDDILVALVDGLVGFPEAITTVFPQTQVHHCVVHLVRQSLAYA